MKLNSFDKVKQLTEEMVAIPSINKEPGGESAVARYIQDFYMSLPYFQAHPEQVKCFQTKNDFVVRHSTLAYVKGTKGNSNRTVILIGHIDTVGVDDFGTIREYAFRCEELPAKLRETFVLPQEVIDDIESGEYLFGRGALDMKSGVAGHMYLIQYFSEHPEELDGNLLAIGECDEEDNSKGIITALDLLEELKEKEHFEYVACINADYSTNYAPGDENRYIYYGSIGKLLPCFAVFGKEAHVGQAFSALDPNLVLANITRKMSLNTDLCDIAQGEVAIPPISLKQMDTKGPYTVQTALTAFGYYNFFTHGWSPSIVLEKSKQMAVEAFDETVEYLNAQYKRFCELSKVDFYQLPWKTRVYTWNEFYNELAAVHGEAFKKAIHEFTVKLHEDEALIYKLLYRSRQVAMVDGALYLYTANQGGLMANRFTPERMTMLDILDERLVFYRENGETGDLIRFTQNRQFMFAAEYYLHTADNKPFRRKARKKQWALYWPLMRSSYWLRRKLVYTYAMLLPGHFKKLYF